MDNNFNIYDAPNAEYQMMPEKKPNRFIEILLALLKCAGYILIWLGTQYVLLIGMTVIIALQNFTVSEAELTKLIYDATMKHGIALTVATNLIALGIFVLIFVIARKPFLKKLNISLPHKASYLPTVAIGGSAQYVTAMILGMIMVLFPQDWIDSFNQGNEMVENAGGFLAFFAVVILAPVFEEILCRGLILNTLRDVMPKWYAIVLSSAIFGIIHGNPIQFIYATAIGILLGWLYTKFNSIWIPMLCHLVFNLMSMLNSYLDAENPLVTVLLGLIVFVSIPIFALSLVYICLKKFDNAPKTEYAPVTASEYNTEALRKIEEEIESNNNGDTL